MAVPTPSATGYQLRGGGRLGRGRGREGCLVLRPKQGLCSCWPNETHWLLGLGSARGRDFWGVTTSPGDKERSCRCPWRGEAPSRGHLHMVGKDKGVDTCQLGWKVGLRDTRGCSPQERGAGTCLCEKLHLPTLLPCHISHPPRHRDHCLLPLHTLGLRVGWLGAWGQRCRSIHTLGMAQDTGTQDKRKTPRSPS